MIRGEVILLKVMFSLEKQLAQQIKENVMSTQGVQQGLSRVRQNHSNLQLAPPHSHRAAPASSD